ncbi:carboxylesterase/lipase family protein [Rhizobium sp. CF142]|uniref:carboxylesterase/lipase family protein n=1 Tax=Rhizobium sp. CF142 TaxID=1144314 RepID=UPI00026EF29A|nr:carboxylesterase family protein [Rhizobium sp. CF142]EJJ29474.1 carboxylesterase type B [Rhizobium sp. CF142]
MGTIAKTTNGDVRGAAKDEGLVFLGMRYGAPTGGTNRFLPPQPVAKWAGVVDAFLPGPSAPQLSKPDNTDAFYSWYSSIQPISEDCLALNVFTPSCHGKRPVMVWLHGGGWRDGSGTAPGFDGSRLSSREDVVVVTVNHRLNLFGFLALDGGGERFADSGNAGVLDIIAALQWVRDNAEAFGGDPANVTIFGESGGASKVAALMASPRAKGLFDKAIVQSSAGARLAHGEEAIAASQSLAQAIGQPRLDPVELQTLPMERLLDASRKAAGVHRGIIDGRTFFDDPFADAAPASSVDIPLLIGCTTTEFTYYMRNDARNFQLEFSDLRRRLARFFNIPAEETARIIDTYRSSEPEADASALLIAIATDQIFKRSTYGIANRQADVSRAPVYAYLFEWETPIENGRMRSPHTCEVPFIFGTTDIAAACIGRGTELLQLSETMMSVWAGFARTGNPRTQALPPWKPYGADTQHMMVLNLEPRLETDPSLPRRTVLTELPAFSNHNPIPALTSEPSH